MWNLLHISLTWQIECRSTFEYYSWNWQRGDIVSKTTKPFHGFDSLINGPKPMSYCKRKKSTESKRIREENMKNSVLVAERQLKIQFNTYSRQLPSKQFRICLFEKKRMGNVANHGSFHFTSNTCCVDWWNMVLVLARIHKNVFSPLISTV